MLHFKVPECRLISLACRLPLHIVENLFMEHEYTADVVISSRLTSFSKGRMQLLAVKGDSLIIFRMKENNYVGVVEHSLYSIKDGLGPN